MDGEAESPLTPPSFKQENNNKESLLSQALAEKPAIFMSNNGGGRSDGHDDSGASDTGSERPESMLDGSLKADSHMSSSFDIHRYVHSACVGSRPRPVLPRPVKARAPSALFGPDLPLVNLLLFVKK